MTTQWLWQLYAFIRAVDDTPTNRTLFANVFVDNGAGEILANEEKIFDISVRLSTTGNEPAQALGISATVKKSMRDDFQAILDGFTNSRYAGVANVAHGQWEENELAITNYSGVTPEGQIVTWEKALTFLFNDFGLIVIEVPAI